MILEDDIKKIVSELENTLNGKDNYSLVKQLCCSLGKKYRALAFNGKNECSQKDLNFIQICNEIEKIYIGKNILKEVNLIIEILSSHIENIYDSSAYKELIKSKAYLEGVNLYTCKKCKSKFPVFEFNGFSDWINVFCSECGNILFISKYDKMFKKLTYQDIEKKLPKCKCGKSAFKFSFGEQIPFGKSTEKYCINCNSSELEFKEISPYEYFHKHEYFYYENDKIVTVQEHEIAIEEFIKKAHNKGS